MARVLLIRSSTHLGGIERQLLAHCLQLHSLGWTPQLVCLYRRPGEHPLAMAATQVGVTAQTINDSGPLSLAPWNHLREITASFRPRLFHSCDYRSDVMVAAKARSKLWVAESHGHTCPNRRMRLWNRLDLMALRRADRVISVSTAWETALASRGVSASRLHTIENSRTILPIAPFSPLPVMSGVGPHLVFAGRRSPEKGLSDLLAVWQDIRDSYPQARLWVLGDPAARGKYRNRLVGLMDQPGITNLGYQPDVRPWLAQADAVIVPSRAEAWGMTAFEALCLGTPVIATRVGGLPNLCRDAPHAWLIPDVSSSALLAGLAAVLNPSFPRGSELGASYLAQPRFDPELRTQKFLHHYESVLELRATD
ncbi:MAG: glycosyltransferase [Caldilineales bacterium]|nr:glycosyltransferase [Caldilineales bacterium]